MPLVGSSETYSRTGWNCVPVNTINMTQVNFGVDQTLVGPSLVNIGIIKRVKCHSNFMFRDG